MRKADHSHEQQAAGMSDAHTQKEAKQTSRLKIWGIRLLKAQLTFLLVLIVLFFFLLFTNAGLRLAVWGAEKALPQLQVEEVKGALLPEFTLQGVQFNTATQVTLNQVTVAVDPKKLLAAEIRINNLELDGLKLALTQPVGPEKKKAKPVSTLTDIILPLPVSVERIELNNVDLSVQGYKVKWQRFTSRLEMQGRILNIHPSHWEKVRVQVAKKEPGLEKKTAGSIAKRATVSLPEIHLPLEINLQQFDLTDFILLGDNPVVVHHLGVSAHTDGHKVKLRSFELDTPQLKASATSQVELIGDYPLTLKANVKLQQTELTGSKVALSAQGSLAEISFSSTLSGKVNALIKGDIQPLKQELPFDLTLTKGRFQWPMKGEESYAADVASFQVKGSLKRFNIALSADVSGKTIPDASVELSGKGDTQQVDLQSINLQTLGGEIQGQVAASWANLLQWQAKLNLQHIQPGLYWPKAEGDISGMLVTSGKLLESGGWHIELPELNIEGIVREYPLTVLGSLVAEDKSGKGDVYLATDSVSILHGGNGLHLTGSLGKEWAMDAKVDIPTLENSLPEGKGQVFGNLALRGSLERPEIKADIQAERIGYQQTSVETVELVTDLIAFPYLQGELSVKAAGIYSAQQKIDSLLINLSGEQAEHRITMNLLSEMVNADLRIRGRANPVGQLAQLSKLVWKGALESGSVSTRQGEWVLTQPTQLSYQAQPVQAYIQAHCWSQSDSKLCLTKDLYAGNSGEAHFAVHSFSFAQIKTFVPENLLLEGRGDLTGLLKWSSEHAPDAKVTLTLSKGKVSLKEEQLEQGWENLALNASLHKDKLDSDWLVDLTDNGYISGKLAVTELLSKQRLLDGRVKIDEINLAVLESLLGEYSELNGRVQSELFFSGPAMQPKVNGDLLISNVRVKGDFTPIEVDSGQIKAHFTGYEAVLNADLETQDGLLQIDGNGNWQDRQAWATNATIFSDGLTINSPPTLKLKMRPDVQIFVSPSQARITGDIYFPWARIEVEELPADAVSISSDQVLLDKNLQPIEKNKPMSLALESDVNLHLGDDFRLTAFGLKGNLNGSLNITQKEQAPFVVGEVEIEEGTYRSFGQDLVINEGKILMNGPVEEPYVAIEAVRNPDNIQDDVTAGIKVTGSAKEPTITVFSDPSMPQANALSYLLRGQNLGAESGGVNMTTVLIGLTIAKSGRTVNEIGEALGVSDLQLDTEGSGDDSQVTVSGYIMPGLKVKYGVGIFNSLGEVTVRYRVMKDLYLEAMSGLDSAVDLLYQFEFD